MTDVSWAEPGVWVLAFLLVCAATNLLASLLLRSKRRRLLRLAEALADEPGFNKADRAWLRTEIENSQDKTVLIVSPLAPIMFLGALAVGFYEGWRDKKPAHAPDLKRQAERIGRDRERMFERLVEVQSGIDPKEGNHWNDPRRHEVADLAFTIETWSHPMATLWICAWLVLALPVVLIGYLIAGSLEPFVRNTWGPFRHLAALAVEAAANALTHQAR